MKLRYLLARAEAPTSANGSSYACRCSTSQKGWGSAVFPFHTISPNSLKTGSGESGVNSIEVVNTLESIACSVWNGRRGEIGTFLPLHVWEVKKRSSATQYVKFLPHIILIVCSPKRHCSGSRRMYPNVHNPKDCYSTLL